MSKNKQWIVNILLVLLPWMSIPFIGYRNVKRFLPASLIIGVIEIINAMIGKRRKWWVFYIKPKSYAFNELPFNLGPFFIVTLWVLKLGYGNLKRFLFFNFILNALFAYPFSFFAQKIKYFRLVHISHFQFFLYFFSKPLLLYWIQYVIENRRARGIGTETQSTAGVGKDSV